MLFRSIPGYRARVVDEDGNDLGPGQPGLLAVQGPTGCRYLADDRQKTYVRDGWNHPGDMYEMNEDGYFRYVARADDMIISAGYNISGPEVEAALLDHDAVAECAVIGVADQLKGQLPMGFLCLNSGCNRPHEEIVAESVKLVREQIGPEIGRAHV